MVRHIVLWTWTEEGKRQERDALRRMQESLASLVGVIPGLRRAELEPNIIGGDCDLVFYAEFDAPEDVPVFRDHPLHVAHREMASGWVTGRVGADFVIDN